MRYFHPTKKLCWDGRIMFATVKSGIEVEVEQDLRVIGCKSPT